MPKARSRDMTTGRTAFFFLCALAIGLSACASDRTFGEQKISMPKQIAHVYFKGGNGLNCRAAAIVQNAKNSQEGVAAEYIWIAQSYPNAKKRHQSLVFDDKKKFDVIEIKTRQGKILELCFDITDFFGKGIL